jgi:hypothetical protein
LGQCGTFYETRLKNFFFSKTILRIDKPNAALPSFQIHVMTIRCTSDRDQYFLGRQIRRVLSPTRSRTKHVRDARGKGGASTAAGALLHDVAYIGSPGAMPFEIFVGAFLWYARERAVLQRRRRVLRNYMQPTLNRYTCQVPHNTSCARHAKDIAETEGVRRHSRTKRSKNWTRLFVACTSIISIFENSLHRMPKVWISFVNAVAIH